MVDKGPLLTSAIIFYLSIGAAIFQILEEPNWKLALSKYAERKAQILSKNPCLTEEDLNDIVEMISSAAGQGVTITGKETFNNWNWPNAVIFSATIITTIGYGNVAPKTSPGRVFCVFYGLFGIPLCLTWISELGKFFGSRAKRFGQFLLKKGLSLRKAQFACTAIFLFWGLVVHLVIPPFIFMYQEGWSYIEGLYFSFVTLTTIGFGDLVTGVDPNADYPVLYRYFVEMWIFLGLAWLSLFFNWNVHMVVEAHKAFKKRRRRHHAAPPRYIREKETCPPCTANNVDIFSFLSEKQEGYNDLIKQIGMDRRKQENTVVKGLSRSKSCSDTTGGNTILTYDHSLRRKRHYSFSDHLSVTVSRRKSSVQSDLVAIFNPSANKLDKEPANEEENVWNVKENQPLLYQETNIFTEKESQKSGEETKTKFSISNENMQWVNCEEDRCSSASEGSVFTSDSSGRCRSYEQLVEKPSKEKNG